MALAIRFAVAGLDGTLDATVRQNPGRCAGRRPSWQDEPVTGLEASKRTRRRPGRRRPPEPRPLRGPTSVWPDARGASLPPAVDPRRPGSSPVAAMALAIRFEVADLDAAVRQNPGRCATTIHPACIEGAIPHPLRGPQRGNILTSFRIELTYTSVFFGLSFYELRRRWINIKKTT